MEYSKAFLDDIQWFPDNLSVVDSRSRVVPLELYPIQVAIEWERWKAREEGRAARIVILKARREGCSTGIGARFYRDAKENDHRKSLVMAHDESATKNVLNMIRFFYDTDKSKHETEKDAAAALKFVNGSEFFIYTAGAGGRAARSFAAQAIHLSELDYFEDPSVFDAVMNIIVEDDPSFQIIVESTARGPDGMMHDLWKGAVAGTNGFTPLFFPWHGFHKYTRPISYADLRAHSPRAYIESHKTMLDAYKEAENALALEVRLRHRDSGNLGDGTGKRLHPGSGGESTPPSGTSGASVLHQRDPATGKWRSAPRPPSERNGRKGKARGGSEGLVPGGSGREGAVPLGPGGREIVPRRDHLERLFDESLNDYERAQRTQHGLTRDQVNWRRWIRDTNCRGSEVKAMHEMPSDPDEAFSISEEVVLDPFTLALWQKEAEAWMPKLGEFDARQRRDGSLRVRFVESALGTTTIFSSPEPDRKYVMGVDPASGMSEGDWQIGCVLEQETGEQVAEFRAKIHPDKAINQVEALALHYNAAFTGVEVNSVGLAWARVLEDRGTLPMFEREVPDRKEPQKKTKLIGWMTNPKTRDELLNEVRRAVREGQCPIRSLETLRECRSLVVSRTASGQERIEARDGTHDDGPFGYGIALQMRLRELPEEAPVVDEEAAEDDGMHARIIELARYLKQPQGRLPLVMPRKTDRHAQMARLIDGRRL